MTELDAGPLKAIMPATLMIVPSPRSCMPPTAARVSIVGATTVAGSLWQSNGLVFTSEIGTPLEPRNVLRRFEARAERAGLIGVHLHTLRHSAASFLLAAE